MAGGEIAGIISVFGFCIILIVIGFIIIGDNLNSPTNEIGFAFIIGGFAVLVVGLFGIFARR
jgi:hypothetical protein